MSETTKQIIALYNTLSDLEKHSVAREMLLRLPPISAEEEMIAIESAAEEAFLRMDAEEEALELRAKKAP